MKINYIYHSCFSVELDEIILLFDYYTGELPPFDPAKHIYAFASHKHGDHFSMDLFHNLKHYPKVTYILSNDIKLSESYLIKNHVEKELHSSILTIAANRSLLVEDLKIDTLQSTDQGVAFSIQYKDKSLYHAGDLNWWHWEGEPDPYNQKMEQHFKAYLQKVVGNQYDVAFLPLDSRQEEYFWWGFDYFMKHTDTKKAFPMHFWEDGSVIDKLKAKEEAKEYWDRVIDTTKNCEWEI